MRRTLVLIALVVTTAVAACGDSEPTITGSADGMNGTSIEVVTHDSFAVSDEVLEAFASETGVEVEVVRAGDAGAALNQAILTKGRPLGDVFFGVDNTFLSRALQEDLFLPHRAARIDDVPARFRLDPEHRVTPVDHGHVCVNYDRDVMPDSQAPTRLADLADPRFRGDLVVENPATSSPGLAFLLATIAEFGEPGWRDYWRRLKANDVSVASGWEEAYYGEFSGGSGEGDRPLVVSYATSPPAEVHFADPPPDEAPTGVVTEGCFAQIEFAGVLRGTDNEAGARAFVDFLLSDAFQEDVALQMFVLPVVEGTPLPDVLTAHAAEVERPLQVPPARIAANRDRWIEEWTSIVLG